MGTICFPLIWGRFFQPNIATLNFSWYAHSENIMTKTMIVHPVCLKTCQAISIYYHMKFIQHGCTRAVNIGAVVSLGIPLGVCISLVVHVYSSLCVVIPFCAQTCLVVSLDIPRDTYVSLCVGTYPLGCISYCVTEWVCVGVINLYTWQAGYPLFSIAVQ